jgi:hypothetical protein
MNSSVVLTMTVSSIFAPTSVPVSLAAAPCLTADSDPGGHPVRHMLRGVAGQTHARALGAGCETAQGVACELFPGGIWLHPDPERGRVLWACAQTAILYPTGLVDADGRSVAEGFPRVYKRGESSREW